VKLAVLELPARFARRLEALDDARRLLARAPCDLAILPECALTGYVSPDGDFDLTRFAEPPGESEQLAALRGLAAGAGCHVAGPIIERDGPRAFNACAVLSPGGDEVVRYRKRHPWYPETWAAAGEDPHPTFSVAGVRATIAICFDIHFVASEADGALAESDLLIFPSAWVDDEPIDGRAALLAGLSRRFGVTIANANWGQGEPAIRGQGGSRVITPQGPPLVVAGKAGSAHRLDVDIDPSAALRS
jgi:predicted amidohydrolase